MIKKSTIMMGMLGIMLFTIPSVMAHCPLCTTGAVVGVGFARAYGVDDSLVGLMLGALIASSALWVNKLLKEKVVKRRYKIPFQQFLLVVLSFLLLTVPLYYKGFYTNIDMVKSMPEHHGMTGLGIINLTQFGVDKLLFGTITGTLAIWLTFVLSDKIKEKRGGKRLFPYQGLVFMTAVLLVLSLLLYIKIRLGI